MSTVNVAEFCAKLTDREASAKDVGDAVDDLGVSIEAFLRIDAETSGAWRASTRSIGLGLGDRACLALAYRLGVPCAHCPFRLDQGGCRRRGMPHSGISEGSATPWRWRALPPRSIGDEPVEARVALRQEPDVRVRLDRELPAPGSQVTDAEGHSRGEECDEPANDG